MNTVHKLRIMFVPFLLLFFAAVTSAQVSAPEDDFVIHSSGQHCTICGVFEGTYKILTNSIEVHLDNAFIIHHGWKSPFEILAVDAIVGESGQSERFATIAKSEELEINQQLGLSEFLNFKDKTLVIPLKNASSMKLDQYWLGFTIETSVLIEGNKKILTTYPSGDKGMFVKAKNKD